MDVRRRLLHEQRRELEKEDPDRIRRPERIVRIDDAVDEDTDDIVTAVLIGRGHPTDQPFTLALLKRVRKARDEDVLKNLTRRNNSIIIIMII